MHKINLKTLEQTSEMGRILANIFINYPEHKMLLLRGDLGSGKTTLTAAIIKHLPGGDLAEVCSPSFTICNLYATTPPVGHCDLYRLEATSDEVAELIDNHKYLTIIEWADFLTKSDLPANYVDIHIQSCDNSKLLGINVIGQNSFDILKKFENF